MPKRKYGGVLGPNTPGGSNPQFGNIETLPNGLNRQTSVINLFALNDQGKLWSRLTFNFPECLGIKQTLDNAAKQTSCIPSLDMDVQIKIPVIKEVHFEVLFHGATTEVSATLTNDYLKLATTEAAFTAILSGDDQLTKSVPDMYDETKNDNLAAFSDFQMASASEVIWARVDRAREKTSAVKAIQKAINPAGKEDAGWLYGVKSGSITGIDYNQVAEAQIGDLGVDYETHTCYIDNIPRGGYKLLKDHVNLFVRTHPDKPQRDGFEIRMMIDYETSSVPLSSLLVWRQQLSEFLPKQIQWRAGIQASGFSAGSKINGFRFLISRGIVKETGEGMDPSDESEFPNIDD